LGQRDRVVQARFSSRERPEAPRKKKIAPWGRYFAFFFAAFAVFFSFADFAGFFFVSFFFSVAFVAIACSFYFLEVVVCDRCVLYINMLSICQLISYYYSAFHGIKLKKIAKIH
jgi:hypothetical protein